MKIPLRERIFHPTYLRLLCLHVRDRGVSLRDALVGTGMTWQQLLHENRLIAFNPARTLILSAKRLTACPSLGLEFGNSVEMAAHGVAGTAVASSRDVSQALEAAIRYRPLRGRAAEFGSVRGDDFLALVMREPLDLGDIRTFTLEVQAAMLDRIMASTAGERLTGIEYRFPYPRPPWAREYSRWLSGEVRFAAEHMEVRVPKKILRLRNVMADDRTRAVVTLPAERELALQRSGSDFAGQIRRRLSEQQGSYPTVQTIADEFNMSPRTLLRKLRQDGATYQGLLDDARKDVAEWYLLKTRVPVEAIAERLGYVDASSFSRAFRRWFGKPPGKFRSDRGKARVKRRVATRMRVA
jgi:AraC-like DNA-binding protein